MRSIHAEDQTSHAQKTHTHTQQSLGYYRTQHGLAGRCFVFVYPHFNGYVPSSIRNHARHKQRTACHVFHWDPLPSPGSGTTLRAASWVEMGSGTLHLDSSSTQETSRADSISGPEEHCSDQTLYQLVHLVHSHVKYVQCHGVNLYIVYSPSCLKKVSHATTRRENPRTLDW